MQMAPLWQAALLTWKEQGECCCASGVSDGRLVQKGHMLMGHMCGAVVRPGAAELQQHGDVRPDPHKHPQDGPRVCDRGGGGG